MTVETQAIEILNHACTEKVSDIYFKPDNISMKIIFKYSTGQRHYGEVSLNEAELLINYLKFNSLMDISEKRRPQIGANKFYFDNQEINLRLSTVGNFINQESMVIRIIYPDNNHFEYIEDIAYLSKKKGLILFSGPVGSGKTTAMYNLARNLNCSSVMSIEDPVEIQESDFLQLQVNEEADLTYETLIKASLRHRPDVLIIGEIRGDSQTAKMVVKAALSGYLVLSTIHAKSKYSAVLRMLEFGVDKSTLEAVLSAAIYQRLIDTKAGVKNQKDILEGYRLKQYFTENFVEKEDSWKLLMKDLLTGDEITYETYLEYKNG